jgi:hypothetical protein
MRRARSKNATRAAALMLSAALVSCGDDAPAQQHTGLRVEIQFDPGTYTVDRFRLEGYDAGDGTEVFEPGSLPLEVGEPFDSGHETAVVLLSDALGGQEVLIKVWGEHQGEIQAFGSATAVIERGAMVTVQVVLGDPPVCGDGEVHPTDELCDTAIAMGEPGACPTAGDCGDGDPCTGDRLLDEGTCRARCESVTIDTCAHGDGCCPVGCAPATDSDCSAVCGDGLIGAGEQCDTGISPGDPGSCPTACADQNPCTEDTLVSAGSCTAHCEFPVITDFLGGDGCCPQGGDATVDSDCTEVCGNGVVEPSEQCDTGIGAGQTGACPQTTADCDDSDPCTTDSLESAGTCQAHCDHETVTALQDGDGCCPAGGSSLTDDDCPVACGNGVVEAGETCDSGISSGSPGACPTAADCDDQLSCTIDSVVNDGTCQAECDHQAITACTGGDGCCPSGCDPSSDSDCQGVCGDGTLDGGETCDTGIA